MIRVFQMSNNMPSTDPSENNAHYLVLGNFDSMDTWSDPWNSAEIAKIISDPFGQALLSGKVPKDSECAYLIGFRDETSDEEKAFWELDQYPYLFITSVQLSKAKQLHRSMTKIEKEISRSHMDCLVRIYTTLESSHFLVCLQTKSFHQGYRMIMEYDQAIRKVLNKGKEKGCYIKKGITNSMINRRYKGSVQEESMDVILRCAVTDFDCYKGIREVLERKYPDIDIQYYGVYGESDRMIMIKGISSTIWRSMYVDQDPILCINQLRKYAVSRVCTEVLECDER